MNQSAVWIHAQDLHALSNIGRLWQTIANEPMPEMVRNVQTQCCFALLESRLIPITVNEFEYENSYVCSPFNAVITYPLEEVRLLPSQAGRRSITGLIYGVSPWLKAAKINRCVAINNWMLSTNLYPRIETAAWTPLIEDVLVQYPKHAILFRSLNRATNTQLIDFLDRRGFALVPSRQVYMYDGSKADFLLRHNSKVDLQFLERQREYEIAHHDDILEDDDERVRQLYDLLYLYKYSKNNPQFTTRLIRNWRETRVMKFFGLRSQTGILDGIVGCFEVEGTLTAPVVGYDTSLPKSNGLYRLLMAIVLREAVTRKLTLNLSSGAAGFKRLRGGKPELEFTAVYYRHLPFHRRVVWRTLQCLLTRIGAPLLERYEL